jgi:hypothetical protein
MKQSKNSQNQKVGKFQEEKYDQRQKALQALEIAKKQNKPVKFLTK